MEPDRVDLLMRDVARGDDRALGELYDALAPTVRLVALRALGDEGLADEVVQDCFLRVWRSAERFDPARGSARTFVFTIARRAAIDARRRAAARPGMARQPGREAAVEDDTVDRLARETVMRDALATLGDKHREVIALVYEQDLSTAQAADRLRIPVGTVRSRTFNAMRLLRDELGRRGVVAGTLGLVLAALGVGIGDLELGAALASY